MLRSWDFKLGCRCDTSRKISHFEKYPEFTHQRLLKGGGRATKAFKSYIQRKYKWNTASTLFSEYVKWYHKTTGSDEGVWKSWIKFTHTDFDLTHGYLSYEYLMQVPAITSLLCNKQKNSDYVYALKLAIYYDLIRFGRFDKVEITYNLPLVVAYELTKKYFRKYMLTVVAKCDTGGHMSYENFRVIKWLYKIYQWEPAKKLIQDKIVRNRSVSPLVHWKGSVKERALLKKLESEVESVVLERNEVKVDPSSDEIRADIWNKFHELDNK